MGERQGTVETVVTDAEFWRGRRVLVTGHTGFKGAWLALVLERLGADVTGLALASGEPSLFEAAGVAALIRSRLGDVRDPTAVEAALTASGAEVVLHLAAQALVRRSYQEPVSTYATNVMGTVHLLDAVRRSPSVRSVVVITSDKCYENQEWVWPYRESEPMGGADPYSNSKGCAELVIAAYRRSFLAEAGIGVASARAGNVIGGGDWSEDRLVPDLIRGFLAGRRPVVRRPGAVRPWQHVLEATAGYLRLAERLSAERQGCAEGWNFGPGDDGALTVGEIADGLARAWGDGAAWEHEADGGPHEAHLLRLDSTKARMRLGWRPRLTLDEALAWIVEWHKAEASGGDVRALTQAQIDRYLDRKDGRP